jgi:hypothetical protein
MRRVGLQGARWGRRFLTRPDRSGERPPDRVNRDFAAVAPNRLWIVDLERQEHSRTPAASAPLRYKWVL